LLVILYENTGSATGTAIFMVVRTAPRLIGAAPIGHIADRMPPERLLMWLYGFGAASTLLLIPLTLAHNLPLTYVVVGAASMITAATLPLPPVVIARHSNAEDRARYNSWYSILDESGFLIAPAVGSALLLIVSPEVLIALDAATFIVAALLMARLPRSVAEASAQEPVYDGVLAGAKTVFAEPVLRLVGSIYFFDSFVFFALQSVIVVIAAQRLGTTTNVGWLYAILGLGGVIGSLSGLALQKQRITTGRIALAGLCAFVSLALIPINPSVAFLVAMLLLCELGSVLSTIWGTTAYQNVAPPKILGQVSSIMWVIPFAGNLAGSLFALLLAGRFGWEGVLVPAGVLGSAVVVAAAVSAARSSRFSPALNGPPTSPPQAEAAIATALAEETH